MPEREKENRSTVPERPERRDDWVPCRKQEGDIQDKGNVVRDTLPPPPPPSTDEG